MLDWVNTIRKREAEEYESDFESIGFGYGTPESVILHKFDYSDEELDEKMLKSLLCTEDMGCELIDNELVFQQIIDNLDHSFRRHGFFCHDQAAIGISGCQLCFESRTLHLIGRSTVLDPCAS